MSMMALRRAGRTGKHQASQGLTPVAERRRGGSAGSVDYDDEEIDSEVEDNQEVARPQPQNAYARGFATEHAETEGGGIDADRFDSDGGGGGGDGDDGNHGGSNRGGDRGASSSPRKDEAQEKWMREAMECGIEFVDSKGKYYEGFSRKELELDETEVRVRGGVGYLPFVAQDPTEIADDACDDDALDGGVGDLCLKGGQQRRGHVHPGRSAASGHDLPPSVVGKMVMGSAGDDGGSNAGGAVGQTSSPLGSAKERVDKSWIATKIIGGGGGREEGKALRSGIETGDVRGSSPGGGDDSIMGSSGNRKSAAGISGGGGGIDVDGKTAAVIVVDTETDGDSDETLESDDQKLFDRKDVLLGSRASHGYAEFLISQHEREGDDDIDDDDRGEGEGGDHRPQEFRWVRGGVKQIRLFSSSSSDDESGTGNGDKQEPSKKRAQERFGPVGSGEILGGGGGLREVGGPTRSGVDFDDGDDIVLVDKRGGRGDGNGNIFRGVGVSALSGFGGEEGDGEEGDGNGQEEFGGAAGAGYGGFETDSVASSSRLSSGAVSMYRCSLT